MLTYSQMVRLPLPENHSDLSSLIYLSISLSLSLCLSLSHSLSLSLSLMVYVSAKCLDIICSQTSSYSLLQGDFILILLQILNIYVHTYQPNLPKSPREIRFIHKNSFVCNSFCIFEYIMHNNDISNMALKLIDIRWIRTGSKPS